MPITKNYCEECKKLRDLKPVDLDKVPSYYKLWKKLLLRTYVKLCDDCVKGCEQ